MKEDRISQLLDPLICQILYHLPIEESVRTNVLSTRWRNLWLWVSCLKLSSSSQFSDFDAFVSFGDRFFDSNRVSCFQKLDLSISQDKYSSFDDVSYLTKWMDVVAKRKIQQLDFSWSGNLQVHTNHLRLYKCETLVSLKLSGVTFDDAKFVSFPCLKTTYLEAVLYPKAALEKLLSRCSVLEELEIYVNGDDKGFQVHSLSLKRLTLFRESYDFEAVPGFVIDAPLLCFLSIDDSIIESLIVKHLESNAKLSISLLFGLGDFDESMRSNIRNLLTAISRVRDMTIYENTFMRIFEYSEVEPLPQFGFMSRLDAYLYASDLNCLPTFLESCPNLKSLILSWKVEEMGQISFSYVLKCMQSSLEFIDIAVPITECAEGMKIVRYFLENSRNSLYVCQNILVKICTKSQEALLNVKSMLVMYNDQK